MCCIKLCTESLLNLSLIHISEPTRQAENNQQTDRQNRWTDSIDRQNDKRINYNTTKHVQTFDKIKLNKVVIHVYTKTYCTKNDKFDIEQTFSTHFDAAHKLFKKNYAFLFHRYFVVVN